MTRSEQKVGSKRLREGAARLFVELRTAPGDASRRALSDWLTTSPDHVAAYLEVAQISGALESAAEQAGWSVDELVTAASAGPADAAPVPLHPNATSHEPQADRRSGVRRVGFRWAAAAAAVSVVIMGVLLSRMVTTDVDDNRYVTATGEQRVFTLEDGSTVHLNTRSELVVRFDRDRRRIDLVRGEAYFVVARDPERPFDVHGGDTVFSALGTRFNVRVWEDRAMVTVVEGRVAVADGNNSIDKYPVELAAGEQASIVGATIEQSVPASLEPATAWTSRRLVFVAEPLSSVLDEFNRYNHEAVRVQDAELSALEISGTFDPGDVDSLLESLKAIRRVEVVRDAQGMRVVRPRP